MTNEETIAAELGSLLQRNPDEAFVVFLERSTEKFVQFVGGRGRSLLLDLPCQSLSEMEFYRAASLFRQHGEKLQELDLLDRPGGVPVDRQYTFQLDLGTDLAKASQVAMEIFTSVYEFPPDFPLVVDRN